VLPKCYDIPKHRVSQRSSVYRLDLGFRVCHSAIRLLTEPCYSAEGRPEDVHTVEGFSAEERNRKYEAVQLQVLFKKKEEHSIPTRRRKLLIRWPHGK